MTHFLSYQPEIPSQRLSQSDHVVRGRPSSDGDGHSSVDRDDLIFAPSNLRDDLYQGIPALKIINLPPTLDKISRDRHSRVFIAENILAQMP